MSLRAFITNHLRRRLESVDCLVFYYADHCNKEIVWDMVSDHCKVIDAGASIIQSRENAMEAWLKLAHPEKGAIQQRQLVIYVPTRKPEMEDEKCHDPFFVFALGGAVFPDGDGDRYQVYAGGLNRILRRRLPIYFTLTHLIFKPSTTLEPVKTGRGYECSWPPRRLLKS